MSLSIVGFRPPDEKWKKMKDVYDACKSAGVDIPEDVEDFFDGDIPQDEGVSVDLEKIADEWGNEYSYGYQIELSELPKHITHIRFCVSP